MKTLYKIIITFSILLFGFSNIVSADAGDIYYFGAFGGNLIYPLLAVLLMLVFFILGYRQEDYMLFIFSGILSLVVGVYYLVLLEGFTYISWIGLILIFFSVYCFYLGLAFSITTKQKGKK